MRFILPLLLIGCGGAPAPTHGGPVDLGTLLAKRVPLYVPGLEMTHQTALDMPGRSDVLIGRMVFPAAGRFTLQAQTPFGMDLFRLGLGAQGYEAQVADVLKGRFPAEGLAREIGRMYLGGCGAGAQLEGRRLRCEVDGVALEEHFDDALAVTRRVFREASGRIVDISYADYGWFDGLWLAGRILQTTGDFRVEVALTEARAPKVSARATSKPRVSTSRE